MVVFLKPISDSLVIARRTSWRMVLSTKNEANILPWLWHNFFLEKNCFHNLREHCKVLLTSNMLSYVWTMLQNVFASFRRLSRFDSGKTNMTLQGRDKLDKSNQIIRPMSLEIVILPLFNSFTNNTATGYQPHIFRLPILLIVSLKSMKAFFLIKKHSSSKSVNFPNLKIFWYSAETLQLRSKRPFWRENIIW